MLRRLGIYLYGRSTESTTVQRLPFGLYLKFNSDLDGLRNEFRALETVRSDTSIPVPEPLDLVSKPTDPHDSFSVPDTYLLITKVPGKPLSGCHDVLSDRDCDDVVSQLRDCVAQLRDMPQTTNQAKMICNTLGEACRDPRIHGGQPVGPFEDETTFSQELRFSDEPARRGHKIVFTHADLNPRNILVSQTARSDGTIGWIVTGIVDWETAGFYPEYWEFTKAMFEGFRWPRRYRDMVSRVFQAFGDYSAELDVETRSWESGDAV
jgi:aminoglycoside phosphotransferase (APT) family kinase protein